MAARKPTLPTPVARKKPDTTPKKTRKGPTLEGRIAALEAAAGHQADLVEMVRDLFAIVKEQGRQVKALAHRLSE